MRDLQWLYQQLGKMYAENLILKEELEKAQAALQAITDAKSAKPASVETERTSSTVVA